MDNIETRLKKIEGQIQGILKMYQNKRDCLEITQQIIAARSALSKVNLNLLEKETESCIIDQDKNKLKKLIKELLKH